MYERRAQVLAESIHVPRKPKGPKDTMMTSVADFIHFISLTGGMTIKEAETRLGVKEASILRWKKKAESSRRRAD